MFVRIILACSNVITNHMGKSNNGLSEESFTHKVSRVNAALTPPQTSKVRVSTCEVKDSFHLDYIRFGTFHFFFHQYQVIVIVHMYMNRLCVTKLQPIGY